MVLPLNPSSGIQTGKEGKAKGQKNHRETTALPLWATGATSHGDLLFPPLSSPGKGTHPRGLFC